jgi:hypothetical protein
MEPLLKDRAIHSQGKKKNGGQIDRHWKTCRSRPAMRLRVGPPASILNPSMTGPPSTTHHLEPFTLYAFIAVRVSTDKIPAPPPCLPLLLYVAPLSRGAQSQCSHILPHLRFAYIPSRILRK